MVTGKRLLLVLVKPMPRMPFRIRGEKYQMTIGVFATSLGSDRVLNCG